MKNQADNIYEFIETVFTFDTKNIDETLHFLRKLQRLDLEYANKRDINYVINMLHDITQDIYEWKQGE